MINIYNKDCLEALKEMSNNEFDLAIVDTPYGLGKKLTNGGGKKGWEKRVNSNADKWDIAPPSNYWNELFRISKTKLFGGGIILIYRQHVE